MKNKKSMDSVPQMPPGWRLEQSAWGWAVVDATDRERDLFGSKAEAISFARKTAAREAKP